MPSRSCRYRRARDSDHPELAEAWHAYQLVRRRLWLLLPHVERRYFRTQDYPAFVDATLKISRMRVSALATWTAACRRVHRAAQITPIGELRQGMHTCYLVRVPKARAIVFEEFLFGTVPIDDTEGRAFLERMRLFEAKARQQARGDALVHEMLAKLAHYLGLARHHAAKKSRILHERPARAVDPEAFVRGSKAAYYQHSEHRRRWAQVQKYKSRLGALGFVYDLDSIATPIVLPEEEPREPQDPTTPAGAAPAYAQRLVEQGL